MILCTQAIFLKLHSFCRVDNLNNRAVSALPSNINEITSRCICIYVQLVGNNECGTDP